MGQTSTERLRDYLGQLPPRSQSLLMREFERALARGDDTTVATLVLEQLRKVVRNVDGDASPPHRVEDIARLVFQPLEPFLVDGHLPLRPGQIRRNSLIPIWQWLVRDGASEQVREFEAIAAASPGQPPVAALRKLQLASAEAIFNITSSDGDNQRALTRIGAPDVIEDMVSIGSVLHGREALDLLGNRLPVTLRIFGDSQLALACDAFAAPALQEPRLLPFALAVLAQRLTAPWQIIRVAIRTAASDKEARVAATPFGMAVTIALHDLFCLALALKADIRRGQFADVADNLKALHDGVRGLRTELDLRQDSNWGRQLASIRAEISNTLQSEIDSVPGRVRRILRQRSERDVAAAGRIDRSEVDDTCALIEFVAVCRNFASELAINEVTLRTYTELQQYVEKTTEALVESLRTGDIGSRPYRQMQADAAVRFCGVLFGREYASQMSRAVDHAMAEEPRKAGRSN